jgi:RNA polymerase subunit RPABC4/transcription elongation factor Spt4
MMNCKKCNAELQPGTTVCPNCGAENSAKAKSNTLLVVLLAVCCIAVGALVAVWVMNMTQTGIANEPATSVPTTTVPLELKSYTQEDATVIANADVVVATAGDQELTVGELQVFYWSSVYEFLNQYSYYLSYIGMDYTQPLDQQVYDTETGATWQEYFLNMAINNWQRYVVISNMAEAADYKLSDEVQGYLDTLAQDMEEWAEQYGYGSVQDMISHDFGAAASYEDYESYLKLYYNSYEYFGSEFDGLTVTNADVENYYAENEETLTGQGYGKDAGNSVDVRHVLIQPEGGTKSEDGTTTTYSDAEWEAARVKAQSLLDAWVQDDGTEEGFANMAKANSADGNAEQGGLYEDITKNTNFVPEFLNWCMDESRKAGDSGLVKTTYGYHIMYFSASEAIWYANAESAFRADVMNKRVEDFGKDYELKTDLDKVMLCFVNLAATE